MIEENVLSTRMVIQELCHIVHATIDGNPRRGLRCVERELRVSDGGHHDEKENLNWTRQLSRVATSTRARDRLEPSELVIYFLHRELLRLFDDGATWSTSTPPAVTAAAARYCLAARGRRALRTVH